MTSGSRAPKHTSTGRCDQRPQPRVAASAAAATLLSVRDLHLAIAGRRRHTPILRGVSLDIAPGEVHGLVGESGAGKTMIGRVILGIQPPRARIVRGSVVFDGRDITHLGEADRRRLMGRGLGLIPQDPMTSLNPAYRIGRQITDVLRLHLGMDRAAAGARARELLDDVHIRAPDRVLRQYPHELSGGMRQRVLIAIAFACRPKLIIADEPTTALDVTVQRQVLALIKQMHAQEGASILFVTHDLGVVAKICDYVTVLHCGRVLETGDTSRIVEAPRHAYTRALMAATPRHDRPGDLLAAGARGADGAAERGGAGLRCGAADRWLNPRSWRRPGCACPCPTSTASRPSAPRPWSISCTALILRWHPAIPWASSAKAALSRTNPSDRLESETPSYRLRYTSRRCRT